MRFPMNTAHFGGHSALSCATQNSPYAELGIKSTSIVKMRRLEKTSRLFILIARSEPIKQPTQVPIASSDAALYKKMETDTMGKVEVALLWVLPETQACVPKSLHFSYKPVQSCFPRQAK
jgi:hypothetical protein